MEVAVDAEASGVRVRVVEETRERVAAMGRGGEEEREEVRKRVCAAAEVFADAEKEDEVGDRKVTTTTTTRKGSTTSDVLSILNGEDGEGASAAAVAAATATATAKSSTTTSTTSITAAPSTTSPALAVLCRVVEIAMSNTSLWKNAMLLDELCRFPDFFVRLAVLALVPTVAAHTTDLATLTAAIELSSKLVLSDDKTMVRRLVPLPPYEVMRAYDRTVHMSGLPPNSSDDYVRELLRPFGHVQYVLRSDMVVKWIFAATANSSNDNTNASGTTDNTTSPSSSDGASDAGVPTYPDPSSGFTKAFVVFERPLSCVSLIATIETLRESQRAVSPSPSPSLSASPALPQSTSPVPPSPVPTAAAAVGVEPTAHSITTQVPLTSPSTSPPSRSSLSASSPDFVPRAVMLQQQQQQQQMQQHYYASDGSVAAFMMPPSAIAIAAADAAAAPALPLIASPMMLPSTGTSMFSVNNSADAFVAPLYLSNDPSAVLSASSAAATLAATTTTIDAAQRHLLQQISPEHKTVLANVEVVMKGEYLSRQKSLATQVAIARLKTRSPTESEKQTRTEAIARSTNWRSAEVVAPAVSAAAAAAAAAAAVTTPTTAAPALFIPLPFIRRTPFLLNELNTFKPSTRKKDDMAVKAAEAFVASSASTSATDPAMTPTTTDESGTSEAAASTTKASRKSKKKKGGAHSIDASGASATTATTATAATTTTSTSPAPDAQRPRFTLTRSTASTSVASRFALGPDDPLAKGFSRGRGKSIAPAPAATVLSAM